MVGTSLPSARAIAGLTGSQVEGYRF